MDHAATQSDRDSLEKWADRDLMKPKHREFLPLRMNNPRHQSVCAEEFPSWKMALQKRTWGPGVQQVEC